MTSILRTKPEKIRAKQSKETNDLGISLTNDVKDLFNENLKTLKSEIEDRSVNENF